MQHYKYSVFKRFYGSPEIGFLKTFFSANIKTLYTYPKSIWYSLRYNSGEKFLLNNVNLYPYKYNDVYRVQELDLEPVGLSNRTHSNISELDTFRYIQSSGYINSTMSIREMNSNVETLKESVNTALTELVNIIRFGGENINLPAAVSARILYALAKDSQLGFRSPNSHKLEEDDVRNLLSCFTKKIEYADGESLQNVIYALEKSNNYNKELWTTLLNEIKNRQFQCEFTLVSNKAPFLFRYQKNNAFQTDLVDDFGNHLFFRGNN